MKTEQTENITFDAQKLARLKQHYANAVEHNAETFVFEGHGLLTAYAKYLIEYLETKFK